MAYILNKILVLCRPASCKNIISGPINKNIFVRSYQHLTRNTNMLPEKRFKLEDNINDNYRLVYREHRVISNTIIVVYHIGWIGLVMSGSFLGLWIYKNPWKLQQEKTEFDNLTGLKIIRPLTVVESVILLIAGFTVSIILILSTRTIPFRIYYNSTEKMYKVVFVNRIFGKKQIETFGEGTVVPLFSRKVQGNVLFNMNGRIVMLDEESFPIPSVRNKMIHKTE